MPHLHKALSLAVMLTETMRIKLTIIHVIIPLLLGATLYISFRSISLRMFDWFRIIEADKIALGVRNLLNPIKSYLPTWTYFSLPDGLWAYSFSSAFIILWSNQFKIGKYWLLLPFLSSCGIELAQGLKIFPGTFDFMDLTFCFSALLLSIIILTPKKEKNETQKQVFFNS